MTKAQKEKRAAFNGSLFIVVLALIIGSYVVNALKPASSVIVAPSTPVLAQVGEKYDTSEFKPFVQYFKHYQVEYGFNGNSWEINSISMDDTYERLLNMGCDAGTSNDEGQGCVLVGSDSIKLFFEGLATLGKSNL